MKRWAWSWGNFGALGVCAQFNGKGRGGGGGGGKLLQWQASFSASNMQPGGTTSGLMLQVMQVGGGMQYCSRPAL